MDQRKPANTIITSPLSIDIPAIDVASYVFSSGNEKLRHAPQYYDAERPSRNFSLNEAEVLVKRFAKGLQTLGLQKGDRVLLFSGNQLYFPLVLWSVTAAGGVFTAASPAATVLELEYQLRDSGARILLSSPQGVKHALKAAKAASLPTSQVYVFCDPDETPGYSNLRSWTSIWASLEESKSWAWQSLGTAQEVKTTTAVINYSSGTTGLPKGVEITHYNLVSNSEQLIFKRDRVADTAYGRKRKSNIDDNGERWLAPLPMYHAFGQTYSCMSAARVGAKVFIMSKFSISTYMQFLDIYRITLMTTVPTILAMLDKYDHPERYNLKSIEVVTSGSAPLDSTLAASVARKYLRAGVRVKQGWGMTETTCSVCGFSPDDDDDGRSIGWLNPNCAVKIVPVGDDSNYNSVSSPSETTVGEIWVAGPQMMKGYWNNETATKETVVESDGYRWIRTGDVGYVDGRGCVYIVDRMKELIKVKGLQVAPAELQLALISHPAVADAAVVGAKINGLEYPRAFIVSKNQVSGEEIFNFIRQRFASHKWLTGGVYFMDAIPRTPSGKVKKRELPDVIDARPWKL